MIKAAKTFLSVFGKALPRLPTMRRFGPIILSTQSKPSCRVFDCWAASRLFVAKILELGSGTGKFTRVMLDVLKYQVIASDPLGNMCFHWFANATALEEINRVLVPGGLFGII